MSLLTPKEAASILTCKLSTVYIWAGKGKIPSYKINGLLRFKKEELEEFINNCKVKVEPIKHIKNIGKRRIGDIDSIVRKAIDSTLRSGYTSSQGKPDQSGPEGRGNGTL